MINPIQRFVGHHEIILGQHEAYRFKGAFETRPEPPVSATVPRGTSWCVHKALDVPARDVGRHREGCGTSGLLLVRDPPLLACTSRVTFGVGRMTFF